MRMKEGFKKNKDTCVYSLFLKFAFDSKRNESCEEEENEDHDTKRRERDGQ